MRQHETFLDLVSEERRRALHSHGSMSSAHEAYSVIMEELCEFWDEVKKKKEERNRQNMLEELVQIAAMAMRAAYDLDLYHDRVLPELPPPWKTGVEA